MLTVLYVVSNSGILRIKTKLRGFGPRENYIDRAAAACWRS
jgi:hypothetical protein